MIHMFKFESLSIILDINSGSIFVVNDLTFELVGLFSELINNFKIKDKKSLVDFSSLVLNGEYQNKFKEYSHNEIMEVINELKVLIENNKLFSEDIKENQKIKNICRDNDGRRIIKSMCLNVAHDCNLVCKYCFASQGSFGGKKMLMSFDVAKAAVDFLIKNSANRKNIEIDFFGGEPLLNFDIVKKIVYYAKNEAQKNGKFFKFTITTNGLLLDDDKISFINEHMSNVVLSLDGTKTNHDFMRRTAANVGSYDIVVPKFQKLVKERNNKNYYIRGTFTNRNLEFTKDLLSIYDLGFTEISFEPAVLNENDEYAIKSSDVPFIKKEYEKLAKKILDMKKNKKEINFFHFVMNFEKGPCAIKRIKGCGCSVDYIAVTPEGDVYPCHQFVGIEKFKMGGLINSEIFLKNNLDGFEYPSVLSSEKCKNCWAKYYCAGGCRANNWNLNKNLDVPYEISCELEKKRLECAIMIGASI